MFFPDVRVESFSPHIEPWGQRFVLCKPKDFSISHYWSQLNGATAPRSRPFGRRVSLFHPLTCSLKAIQDWPKWCTCQKSPRVCKMKETTKCLAIYGCLASWESLLIRFVTHSGGATQDIFWSSAKRSIDPVFLCLSLSPNLAILPPATTVDLGGSLVPGFGLWSDLSLPGAFF